MTRRTWWFIGVPSLLLCVACLGGSGLIYLYYPFGVNESITLAAGQDPDGQPYKHLVIGNVVHGMQFVPPSNPADAGGPDKDFSRLATTCSHRNGPFGRVMETMNWFPGPDNTFGADARMPASLVALGTSGLPVATLPYAQLVGVWSEPPFAGVFLKDGAIASYARPFQWLDLYERSSALTELSLPKVGGPLNFTFVQDAQRRGANVRVREGHERTTLANRGPRGFYKVLVVDTTRGNAEIVMTELLTKEALALYFELLVEDGIVCIHVSNRIFNLDPVVADAAQTLKLFSLRAHDRGNRSQPARGHYGSEWVLVARKADYLRPVMDRAAAFHPRQGQFDTGLTLVPQNPTGRHLWTDAGSKSLGPLVR